MKELFIKFGFNLIMFALGVAILLIMLNKGGTNSTNNVKITVSLAKKPVIRNYTFTNPTVYKETTIEHSNTHVITKEDSNRIVIDYLKSRIYIDSIVNDTAKIKYIATVEKNALKNIGISYSYKPVIIHEKETKIKNGLLIGLTPGWVNGPTIGFSAGFQTREYSYGILYDPIRNPQGGYLVINKRIFFKK